MRGMATPCHQDGRVAGTPATPTPAIPAAGLGQELSKAAPWCLVGAQTLPQRPQRGGPSSLLLPLLSPGTSRPPQQEQGCSAASPLAAEQPVWNFPGPRAATG